MSHIVFESNSVEKIPEQEDTSSFVINSATASLLSKIQHDVERFEIRDLVE